VDNNFSVFGVFDGHGGREVAKFVSLYLVRATDLHMQPCSTKQGFLGCMLIMAKRCNMFHQATPVHWSGT